MAKASKAPPTIDPPTKQPQSKPVGPNRSKFSKALFVLILVTALGGAGYFYKQTQDLKTNSEQTMAENQKLESDKVLGDLKKILLINEADTPTVARIDDPAQLKATNQEFYKDVQQADYLIVYPSRAIIYRSFNNQIINVAPIVKAPTTP